MSTFDSFESFLSLHDAQLRAMGFPTSLYRPLYEKLAGLRFDAGEFFSFVDISNSSYDESDPQVEVSTTEGDGERSEATSSDSIGEAAIVDKADYPDSDLITMDYALSLLPTRYRIQANKKLRKNEDVFLVDHMW